MNSTNKQTLKFYWQQIRKHKISFFLMLVFIPLSSLALDTILPLMLSQAIGTLDPASTSEISLSTFLWLAVAAAIAGIAFNLIGFQSMIYHESRIRARLIDAILSRLVFKDYTFYAKQKIGALTGKFIDFINAHVGLQDLVIIRTLTFILNIGIGITVIALNSPLLALLVAGLIAILLIQIRWSLKAREPLRKERKRLVAEHNGAVADTISNSLTVKTFANEEHELSLSRRLAQKYRDAYMKDFSWMAFEGSMRHVLMSAIQIAAVAIMASLYFDGQLELGIAIFVVAYLQRVAGQLFMLGDIINGYDRFFLQAAHMTEILSENDTITDPKNAKPLTVSDGRIDFKDISYAYEDDRETKVIDRLSLSVPAGQKVGLIGRSGAGKTTLTKTLLRFDDITEGAIEIDGHNIQQITQDSLRHSVAYVPQEPVLFHRTLRENIAYGRLSSSDEQIIEAAKKANAWEFIQKLPNGLDTIVGERGAKLSGGQRQRIAIARAILKDAPILVLDEATSALDSESEKLIQDALDKLMVGRTSLVIAHRLSTIAKLDRVIVLDGGKIIEDGTHRELLSHGGIYANLWSHQSGGFIED